ncbi:DUF2336 domain-containing protein [Telmatospirillum sp.]|uniref:DUF2336 domain-containing protein n=1 Tax=Telmatospirillum sp. TaxID=2079197 RepID=UPI00284ADFC9|nr:DUF2336 domain-containing protein [Telmatospirillum sp.]MDR3436494.1 DUF2336 domain-containing protein [Telmatospirillum sp.]
MAGQELMASTMPISYEQAREIAADPEWRRRHDLALRPDAPAEVLFFLCGDEEVVVRAAVAANRATPAKGNLLLARDAAESVRHALAVKIGHFGRRVGVTEDQARPAEIMDEVATCLAGDSLVDVRAIIANVLKNADDFDRAVIIRLAGDRDIVVAQPILEHSPLLGDEILLELIASNPAPGVLAAIARRAYLDAKVTSAVVAAGDTPAIAHLLRNTHASLQEDTLDALVENAAVQPSWQEPLVFRPELSETALDRVIEMVSSSVLDRILVRRDLPPQAATAITKAVAENLRAGGTKASPSTARTIGPDTGKRYAPWLERAQERLRDGQLDETAILVSVLTDRQEEVVAGLSVRAKIGVSTVLEILASQSARAICSLTWAAGLSAALAVELQLRFGNVSAEMLMKPGPDDAFALSDEEMAWHLDMFRAVDKPGNGAGGGESSSSKA